MRVKFVASPTFKKIQKMNLFNFLNIQKKLKRKKERKDKKQEKLPNKSTPSYNTSPPAIKEPKPSKPR